MPILSLVCKLPKSQFFKQKSGFKKVRAFEHRVADSFMVTLVIQWSKGVNFTHWSLNKLLILVIRYEALKTVVGLGTNAKGVMAWKYELGLQIKGIVHTFLRKL